MALIAADQRMPQMTGIEMLEQARTHAPDAKFLLLTAYADTDVAIKAINDIGLDYYLLKPWDPPEERLYPVIDDLLGDWQQANPDHTSDVRVVGHRWSDRSHEIKMFLARNHVPYRWYDVERDAEAERLRGPRRRRTSRPAAGARARRRHAALALDPRSGRRARAAHHARSSRSTTCASSAAARPDLAAAVYAASEGLSTVIVEREAPGGQAGQSAAIENYLGFPEGPERLRPRPARDRPGLPVRRRDGAGARRRRLRDPRARARRAASTAPGRSRPARVIVATGVSYRRLDADGPRSSSPAAASTTARTPAKRASARATRSTSSARPTRPARLRSTCPATPSGWCWWFARTSLADTMSHTCRHGSQSAANIDGAVPQRGRGGPRRRPSRGPHTCRHGHRRHRGGAGELAVHLHRRVAAHRLARAATSSATTRGSSSPATSCWVPDRPRGGRSTAPPFALETSVPGVFAAGDVRLDSMKRVASAVGEGAMSVYLVHRYLATI